MEDRLQKILARAGYGSRRACELMITEGRVTVNGRPAELGQRADPARDRIEVDHEPLPQPERTVVVLLNKPRGVVSSLAAQGERKTVRDLVPQQERLYPVGRLDVDSEGLILLTNDGELTDYLTHPRYESEKEYRVLVRGTPDEARLNVWRHGVMLEGRRTAPADVRREEKTGDNTWLRVIMHEGRKHQIRDIGTTLGMPVLRLTRVRMGGLTLGNLRPGEWRELTAEEIERLRSAPRSERLTERRGTRRPRAAVGAEARRPGGRKPSGGSTRSGRPGSGGRRPGAARPGSSGRGGRPGGSRPGAARPGPSRPSASRRGGPRPGGTRPGGARPGTRRPGGSRGRGRGPRK